MANTTAEQQIAELQRQLAAMQGKLDAATKQNGVVVGVSASGLVELRITSLGRVRRVWAEPEAIETLFANAQGVAEAITANRDKFRTGPDDARYAGKIAENKQRRTEAQAKATLAKAGIATHANGQTGQVKVAL